MSQVFQKLCVVSLVMGCGSTTFGQGMTLIRVPGDNVIGHHLLIITNCYGCWDPRLPQLVGEGLVTFIPSSFSVKLFVPGNELLVQIMCEFHDKESKNFELGLFKVLLICHLLVTYCLTYFTTYLIMRTRRRAISDGNKNNELQLPFFLFAHLFTHFLLCLSVHLF